MNSKSQNPEILNSKNAGWTPLHIAAERDRAEIVELLLEKGARVNGKDDDGRIPLSYAASGGVFEFDDPLDPASENKEEDMRKYRETMEILRNHGGIE